MTDDAKRMTVSSVTVTTTKQITVTVTEPALELLRDLSALTGVSVSEVTNEALQLSIARLTELRDKLADEEALAMRASMLRTGLREVKP